VANQENHIQVAYGLTKLQEALESKGISYEVVYDPDQAKGKSLLLTGLDDGICEASLVLHKAKQKVPQKKEALCIREVKLQGKPAWVASGYDNQGLMYALLSVADHIRFQNENSAPLEGLVPVTESPDIETRAISTYTMNRTYWESRLWDESYWASYFDELARNRFNAYVVIFGYENGGFLAPCYPYFFNVEAFPEVKMPGLSPEQQAENLASLRRMIDLAHERGLELKIGIWDHIYRGGIQSGGLSGEDRQKQSEDFLVHGVHTENLFEYTTAAFARFIELLPGLDGVQFRMHNESGLKPGKEMELFWTEMFGSIQANAPELKIELRAKELPDKIIDIAEEKGLDYTITTKYWMEQMGLPFHPTHINRQNQFDRRHGYADLLRYPKSYDILWRMWTAGTQRVLLWGNPEYTRRFAKSTHLYDGIGFEINEPLATKMLAQPHNAEPFRILNPGYEYYTYEFERYWYYFQSFGRVAYNPHTPSDVFTREFNKRFGEEAGPLLQEALHKASFILPRINAACAPYGLFPTTRGWAAKQTLGELPKFAKAEGSDIQQFASFDEEALILIEAGETAKVLPSQTSLWFFNTSQRIETLVQQSMNFCSKEDNKEFLSTITDLRILSGLAQYHASRIPAAVSYRIFEHTEDPFALDDAIAYEIQAIRAWQGIVEAAGEVYSQDLMMGTRETTKYDIVYRIAGHWKDELKHLEKGLEELKNQRQALLETGEARHSPENKAAEDLENTTLFQIQHDPPANVRSGTALRISAHIDSPAGIKWVRLRYRSVNQHLDYQSLLMSKKPGSKLYEVNVPAEAINERYDFMYFFEVMDKEGNGRIYPDLDVETPYYVMKLLR
jgi:hypothetical protein